MPESNPRAATTEMGEWSLGRLLSTAARLVEHDWNAWLARHDLTHAGLVALHALRRGPHTQRELAAACLVEEQTMSRVVERLQRSGYVTRVRDDSDRRRFVVRSTEHGRQAYDTTIESDVANTLVDEHIDDPDRLRAELQRIVVGLLATRGDS